MFNGGGRVCGCTCVYTHTYTHTAQMGYWMCAQESGSGDTWRAQRLNLGTHIFVYVYKVHMCMYMLGGGMRSWTDYFFLQHIFSSEKEKQKM